MTETASPAPLFQKALGAGFDDLPAPVRALHTVDGRHVWSGEARVTRGTSRLAGLLCRIIGFPPAADRTPVSVTIERRGEWEVWRRDFGGRLFETVLGPSGSPGSGLVRERFGPLAFDIQLKQERGALAFPVSRSYFLRMPLPGWLLPVSDTREHADGGRFHFDVQISLPGAGMLVHYQGWLMPQAETAAQPETVQVPAGR